MPAPAHVLVIDIGKTNAKLALVDTGALAEIEVLTQPNRVAPRPALSARRRRGALDLHPRRRARRCTRRHRVDAVVVTTHGATAALLDADGGLALPVLDYEHDGPDEPRRRLRRGAAADFAETGSPRLPLGLNLGAQLFWQFRAFPEAAAPGRARS